MKTLGTSFFPDVNVWVALADSTHIHNRQASNWFRSLPSESTILITRFTQLGLLRLLTNPSAMGPSTRTMRQAWDVFDQLLEEPRISYQQQPVGLDAAFRKVTERLGDRSASKWLADCYLLPYAKQSNAILVTFDKGLLSLAKEARRQAIAPDLSEGAYA